MNFYAPKKKSFFRRQNSIKTFDTSIRIIGIPLTAAVEMNMNLGHRYSFRTT